MNTQEISDYDVAIIGMSGRFPMASNIEQFWSNIINGKDCISREPEKNNRNYIAAYGKLDNIEYFDADFFNMTRREALDSDPQQRFLLEGIYEALEDAGCNLKNYDGRVGLFASCDEHVYVWNYIMTQPGDWHDNYHQFMFNCDGTFLTKIAYKLNLQGPTMLVKYACASSLAAIHVAYEGLLNYDYDIAVAGGVSIEPEQDGYYTSDQTLSRGGVVRSFDKKADGFVPGHAQGVIIMKRLKDAIKDHDHIISVIKGTSANNDGNRKVGFAAPSVSGQEECIWDALSISNSEIDDISYIETHGTATVLGDSVELRALKNVFYEKKDPLMIGSVKANIGHTNAAAGVSNIIKVSLMLKNKVLPPSINFDEPNDELLEKGCPIKVNDKLIPWEANKTRMAAISAFGMGGANAIAVLSEYIGKNQSDITNEKRLFVVSAKTDTALNNNCEKLKEYFEKKEVQITDAAYTLQVGREHFQKRYSFIASNKEEALNKLNKKINPSTISKNRNIIFAVTGSGSLGESIGYELYKENKIFKEELDNCFKIIKDKYNIDCKKSFLELKEGITETLKSPVINMLLTYSVGYCIGKLWINIGVEPDVLIGHSLGEYICATLAGIFSLDEALKLIVSRATLFEKLPEGRMLSVLAKKEDVEPILPEGVTIGAINAEKRLMLTGYVNDIEKAKEILREHKITSIMLNVARAGHCEIVRSICDDYEKILNEIKFKPAKYKIFSSCLAKFNENNEMSTPQYWINQLCEPVLFYKSVQKLASENTIWIEIGTSDQLTPCIRKTIIKDKTSKVVPSVTLEKGDTNAGFLSAIGKLWESGHEFDWDIFYKEQPYKTQLPTYSFERKPYWRYKKVTNGTAIIEEKSEFVEEKNTESSFNEVTQARNELDKVLIRIFKDALELESLNIYEDLFELGFDSLTIVIILKQIETELNKTITLKEIYNYTNIAQISDYISTLDETVADKESIEDINKKSIDDLFDGL